MSSERKSERSVKGPKNARSSVGKISAISLTDNGESCSISNDSEVELSGITDSEGDEEDSEEGKTLIDNLSASRHNQKSTKE